MIFQIRRSLCGKIQQVRTDDRLLHVRLLSIYMQATYQLCTLCLDPSTVPLSKLKKTTNDRGESFYEVKYVLRLTVVDEVTVSRLLLLVY